jgi:glyoxylase-like metal-dependent hydrolase (beta-lactamase superfamily II)
MKTRFVVVAFAILAWALGTAWARAIGQQSSPRRYEVYAIRYGVLPDFQVADLLKGADTSRRLDIPMMFWLLKGPDGRNILVDSGFYRDTLVKQWTVKDFVRPSEAIAKVGLRPGDITDVVVTHMHWDHAGGVDLFPNAVVWVQRDEYAYYTGEAWQSKQTHGGIEPDDVLALVKLNTAGRLRLINGDDQEPIAGIRCYLGGRHTWASQYLTVATRSGTVVLASDNVYLYENLDTHAPIAQTLDEASNLKAQDRMRGLASDVRLIVPGHDPAVFTRFPQPGNGVARIGQ